MTSSNPHPDDVQRAADELGIPVPATFMHLGAGEGFTIGTAATLRAAAAILARLDGAPVEQCWPASSTDPRTLSELRAEWKEQRGQEPPRIYNMGFKLRRDLRTELGPEIKGLPRAVALEIADTADDETGESRASLDDLARWTAAKDTAVVRDALKRLAEDGWEFRVPIGKGKDGRLLYARPGVSMRFKVPPKKGSPKPKRPKTAGTATDKEGVLTPSEGVRTPCEGVDTPSEGVRTTPLSFSPFLPSLSFRAHEADRPAAPAVQGERENPAPPKNHDADSVIAAYTQASGRPMVNGTRAKLHAQVVEHLADGFPAAWLADRAREMAAKGWLDLRQHVEHSQVPIPGQAQPTPGNTDLDAARARLMARAIQ